MSAHLVDLSLLRLIKEEERPVVTLGQLKLLSATKLGKSIDVDGIEERTMAMTERGWLSSATVGGVKHFWLLYEGEKVLREEPTVARDKPGLTNR
jgi:hypothetical protein